MAVSFDPNKIFKFCFKSLKLIYEFINSGIFVNIKIEPIKARQK